MSHNRKIWTSILVLIEIVLLNACTQRTTLVPAESTDSELDIASSVTLMMREAADCSYGGKIKSIKAVNEYTVDFTLCFSDGAFLSKIASPYLSIQSARHLQETGGKPLREVLGTGPYMVKEWVQNDYLMLEKNPNYWGNVPKNENLMFVWNSEASARFLSLKAGTVDGIDNPDPDQYDVIRSDPALSLYLRPPFSIFYIGLPNTKPPLDNDKVRQALAIGIDRESIVDNFFPPGSTVADYLAPCVVPGGCVGSSWPEYDPERAKALLTEAGFPDGLTLDLSYRDVTRPYLPFPSQVAVDIQSQLSKIGVDVELDAQESSTFVANSVEGNLGMHLLGWTGKYPDQTNFVDIFFGENADESLGNHWPNLEEKIAEAATLSEQVDRNELYAQVNDMVVNYVPLIPVTHSSSAVAFKSSVNNAYASPISLESFQDMYIEEQEQLIWMQSLEPDTLYCADDPGGDTTRICIHLFDSLYSYKADGTGAEPHLAEECTVSPDELTWTCMLREDVFFSDGTPLTANDVVATYAAQWDAADPLHVGTTGTFYFWQLFFGPFLNSPDSSE